MLEIKIMYVFKSYSYYFNENLIIIKRVLTVSPPSVL